LGGRSISDKRLPTDDERATLKRRANELRLALRGVGEHGAIQTIAQLFLGFHGQRGSHDETAAQLALFASQVADFPLWAVQSGCGDLLRKNVAWPPTVGQVRAACSVACQSSRDEFAQINQILSADVYHEPGESEREAVQRKFADLLAELKLSEPIDPLRQRHHRTPTRQEAQEWIDELKANSQPLPEISDRLRAVLSIPPSHEGKEKAA
jgi:hypothetical protein